MEMTRRGWIRGCAAGVLGMVSAGCRTDRGTAGVYSVVVLGDTHYDKAPATVYHKAYPGRDVSARLEAIQRAEFARNGEMWATRIPRLLAAAKAARRPDTAFALQVGDLIQGDCNDGAVHAQMATDAYSAIHAAVGDDVPLRLVVGNHDIRNGCHDDAAKFYRDWMNARMTEACGAPVSCTTFAYTQGPDLWIHVDFTDPKMAVIEQALADHPDARYTFLVTHGPVIPSDGGSCQWMLYGGRKRAEERRHLWSLLERRNAIVVAGHIHTTELTECVRPAGRLVQVIVNSVWKSEDLATAAPQYTSPEKYGSAQKKPEDKAFLAEYRPSMTRHYRSLAAGFCRLEVASDGVYARVFGGDARTPYLNWKLR